MQDERGELVPMAEALAALGCSHSSACRILRLSLNATTGLSLGGRLEGRLYGRSWFVYAASIPAAVATMRRDAGKPRSKKRRPRRSA